MPQEKLSKYFNSSRKSLDAEQNESVAPVVPKDCDTEWENGAASGQVVQTEQSSSSLVSTRPRRRCAAAGVARRRPRSVRRFVVESAPPPSTLRPILRAARALKTNAVRTIVRSKQRADRRRRLQFDMAASVTVAITPRRDKVAGVVAMPPHETSYTLRPLPNLPIDPGETGATGRCELDGQVEPGLALSDDVLSWLDDQQKTASTSTSASTQQSRRCSIYRPSFMESVSSNDTTETSPTPFSNCRLSILPPPTVAQRRKKRAPHLAEPDTAPEAEAETVAPCTDADIALAVEEEPRQLRSRRRSFVDATKRLTRSAALETAAADTVTERPRKRRRAPNAAADASTASSSASSSAPGGSAALAPIFDKPKRAEPADKRRRAGRRVAPSPVRPGAPAFDVFSDRSLRSKRKGRQDKPADVDKTDVVEVDGNCEIDLTDDENDPRPAVVDKRSISRKIESRPMKEFQFRHVAVDRAPFASLLHVGHSDSSANALTQSPLLLKTAAAEPRLSVASPHSLSAVLDLADCEAVATEGGLEAVFVRVDKEDVQSALDSLALRRRTRHLQLHRLYAEMRRRRVAAAADEAMWTDLLRPLCADDVCGQASAAGELRGWLGEWQRVLRADGKRPSTAAVTRRPPRRGRRAVASSDSDDSTDDALPRNPFILHGPSGVGKTSLVYALAAECRFSVLEVGCNERRTQRSVVANVEGATRSHRIAKPSATASSSSSSEGTPERRHSTLSSFLRAPPPSLSKAATAATSDAHRPKTVVLFDDADVVFADEEGFYQSVRSLCATSRVPIVLTCADSRAAVEVSDGLGVTRLRFPERDDDSVHFLQALCLATSEVWVAGDYLRRLLAAHGLHLRATLLSLQLQLTAFLCDGRQPAVVAADPSPAASLSEALERAEQTVLADRWTSVCARGRRPPEQSLFACVRDGVGGDHPLAPSPTEGRPAEDACYSFSVPVEPARRFDVERLAAVRQVAALESVLAGNECLSVDYASNLSLIAAAESHRRGAALSRRFYHYFDKKMSRVPGIDDLKDLFAQDRFR